MVDKELVQAMQGMIQENNKALGQMIDEKLAAQEKRTDEKFAELRQEMTGMRQEMAVMQEDIAEIKENTAITRSAANSLIEWAENVGVVTQVKFPIKKAE